jgi:hypothetical protein
MPTTTFEALTEFQHQVEPYSGPIFFSKSSQTPLGNVTNNGSFGLVDTGKRKLLVTCHHVWRRFQEERSKEPNLQMCLCLDRPFCFTPGEPVGEDKSLDIATFDIDPLLGGSSRCKFCPWNQNTAPTIAERDVILFIGYPAYLRHESAQCIEFGRSLFWMKAGSVTDRKLLCDIASLTVKTPPEQFPGMSGCPCFLVHDYKAVELAGFVSEVGFGQIIITLARCIGNDGSVG